MTPQMVQIIHIGNGWCWSVYNGLQTFRGVERTFEAAWACIDGIVHPAPAGRTWQLAGTLAAEAG